MTTVQVDIRVPLGRTLPELAGPNSQPVLERISRMTAPTRDMPELHAFLRSIGAEGGDPRRLVEDARAQNPALAEMIEPMLGATLAPTGVSAQHEDQRHSRPRADAL